MFLLFSGSERMGGSGGVADASSFFYGLNGCFLFSIKAPKENGSSCIFQEFVTDAGPA
jgi:hypothetical protein